MKNKEEDVLIEAARMLKEAEKLITELNQLEKLLKKQPASESAVLSAMILNTTKMIINEAIK